MVARSVRDAEAGGSSPLAPTHIEYVRKVSWELILMLWSPVRIEGKPSILIVDASYNLEGWERAFCARLYGTMSRRGLALAGDGPIVVRDPEDFLSQTGSNISYNS